MKLITKAIQRVAPALYTTSEKDSAEVRIVAKFFNPCGRSTWYMTEYDPGTGQAFGFVRGEFDTTCDELGYFDINELESLCLPFGLGIERDMHFGCHTLAEVMEGASP